MLMLHPTGSSSLSAATPFRAFAHRHRVDLDTLLLQVLRDEIGGLRRLVCGLDADDSDSPRTAGELYNAWLPAFEKFSNAASPRQSHGARDSKVATTGRGRGCAVNSVATLIASAGLLTILLAQSPVMHVNFRTARHAAVNGALIRRMRDLPIACVFVPASIYRYGLAL